MLKTIISFSKKTWQNGKMQFAATEPNIFTSCLFSNVLFNIFTFKLNYHWIQISAAKKKEPDTGNKKLKKHLEVGFHTIKPIIHYPKFFMLPSQLSHYSHKCILTQLCVTNLICQCISSPALSTISEYGKFTPKMTSGWFRMRCIITKERTNLLLNRCGG